MANGIWVEHAERDTKEKNKGIITSKRIFLNNVKKPDILLLIRLNGIIVTYINSLTFIESESTMPLIMA